MILVTGANGFLGQYICQRLLEEGHEVRALVRDSRKMDSFPARALLEIHEADLLDPVLVAAAMEGISVVIHCAALISFDPSDCREMMETNVAGTRNLVNICLDQKIDRLIHISSVAAIGRMSSNGTIDENAKWQESKLNTCYGQSKYEAELEVWRAFNEGLSSVILNPSIIVGRPVPGAMSNKVFDYLRNKPTYYPSGHINYVDVRDVCEAIIRVMDAPVNGERFILNASSIPYREFYQEAAKRMGVKPPQRPAGTFVLRLAMWADIIRCLFSGKKRMLTRETIRLSAAEIYFANEKARRELNISFASLSETMDWILAAPEPTG